MDLIKDLFASTIQREVRCLGCQAERGRPVESNLYINVVVPFEDRKKVFPLKALLKDSVGSETVKRSSDCDAENRCVLPSTIACMRAKIERHTHGE
jgi:hypothetical protein